jgi:hAT family C-terminal dimerisation region
VSELSTDQICALELLHELNTHGAFYTSLYQAYKFALTLSCTQVSCERVFSVLKIIKNRLRSSLGQDLLEDLMLLYVERDFVFDYIKVIDDIASSSIELSRLLKL